MSFIDDSIKRLREEEEERRKRERAIQLIREPQKASNSNSTNSSTSTKNSSQTAQTGLQSTPAERDLFKITGRRHTVTDRRRGIDKNEKTQRSTAEYGTRVNRNENDRFSNTVKGAGKQWLGGQLSGVGTYLQDKESIARGYNNLKAEDERPQYSLRSRDEAEKTNASRIRDARLKEGVDKSKAERDFTIDPNTFTQKTLRKGDSLIESGTADIEKAKEGANDFEKFLIDNGAQFTQWAGDASLRLIPVVGQALSLGGFFNRAGGMSAYQGRQEGMNPDQQYKYYLGSGLMEAISELTFQSVGALRATYGKGMFSIADKLTTKASTSGIVRRLLDNTELGKSLYINLARLGGNAVEEGLEEVETDLVDPLLKYFIKKSEDPKADFEGWDWGQMGYDFLMGATMGGVLGVAEVPSRVKYELNIANSDAFNDGMVTSLIKQASVQGRQSDGGRLIPTNAEILAQQLQQQMDNNIPVQPAQIRMLQEAIGQSISENQKQLTRRMTEEYDKAQKSGDLVQMEGTRLESQGIDNASVKLYDDATEKARQVLGEDATQEEVEAVAGVTTGLASTNEIDTVLVKPELKKAVETIVNEGADAESTVSIPVNNAEARDVLENLTAVKRIANRNTILKDVQAKNADIIKSSVDTMSEGGKNLFASRAEFAQDTIGGNRDRNLEIYRDRFSRLYTDGNTKGADFETSYKRIIGSLDSEALKSVFTEDFARQIFDEGKKAIVTDTAKETAKSRAEEYANRKGGLTFENNNENLISSWAKEVLQKFAERVGVEIHIVKSLSKDASGKALMSRTGKKLVVNGKYQDGVIYIASDAQNKLITVAKHELTHHLKETSPEMYQKLEDFVFEKWYHGNAEEMEDEIARYTKLYSGQGLDRAGIREEIIADASEAFFTDEGAIQDAISFSEKLGRAIHDGIKTMLDAFLGLQDADSRRMRGYGGFLKDLGILQEAERMWLEALEDTQQRKRNARGNATTEATSETGEKFSVTAEEDQAYMDAVNRGDMETAQRMVDEEAKKHGYEFRGYHGTKLPTLNEYYEPTEQTDYANKILPYTIFKPGISGGIYVATNKAYPEIISKSFSGEKGTVMGLYVKLKNPLVVNEHVYDGVPKYYNIPTPSIMKKDGYTQDTLGTEEISHYAQEHGYDGVIIEGLLEGGAIYTDDYIAFSPEQLKLADPVTYDDDGNVIPLSERFNESNEDIRYSMTDDIRYSRKDFEGEEPKRRITEYSTGAYSGQVDMTMESYDGDNLAGSMQYSVYDGTPNIQYIHTESNYRGQGIAREMLQRLQSHYPNTEINWGMTTPDGTKLKENVTYEVRDKKVTRKKKRLQSMKKEISENEKEMNDLWEKAENRDFTEEERSQMQSLGKRWDKLNRDIHNLEIELEDAHEVTYMVKMDDNAKFSLKESETEETETEKAINESMTMEQCRQMIQRCYNIGEIREWSDGEYKNGDEWIRAMGSEEVGMVAENDWSIQQKYLDKIDGILNEDFTVYDVLDAYLAGTLRGKEKSKPTRLDTSKGTGYKDSRFYSPQLVEDAVKALEVADQKMTAKNKAEVNKARAKVLLFAHNAGAEETLGLTRAELNKKLRSWSNYSSRARDISKRINANVAPENRWTGIENLSWLSRATVSNDELANLVKDIKGESSEYERSYIARTMLALDTHIDWTELSFEFRDIAIPDQRSVKGFYSDKERKIVVEHNRPNSLAHEMGHALDNKWGREISGTFGKGYALTSFTKASLNQIPNADVKKFANNFYLFMDEISDFCDIRSDYTGRNNEVFARFVDQFVRWTEKISTGRSAYSSFDYNDRFNQNHFIEFARLLQEKASLDARGLLNSTEDTSKLSVSDDEVLDRYIVDRQKRIDDGEQMSFFGSLNETLPSKPKEKTRSEKFYDNVLKTIANIKKKGSWSGFEVKGLFLQYPEFNFIERLNNKADETAVSDFNAFLSSFDKIDDLRYYNWFFSAYEYSSQWKKANRSGKMKFNKLIENRIEEIMAGKAHGRNVGIEKRDYTPTEMRKLFNELNTDKELEELGKKVFDCIDKNFDVKFQGVANIEGFKHGQGGTLGQAGGRTVHLNMKYLNSEGYTDQQKASTILHESIHVVTVYALRNRNNYTMPKNIQDACDVIEDVFWQIKDDPMFKGEYGVSKGAEEMVAELSNPIFREKLRRKNVFARVIEAIRNILGIEVEVGDRPNAFKEVNKALETLMSNADVVSFERYANKVSRDYNGKFSVSEEDENAPTPKEYQTTIAKLEEKVADLKSEFKRTDLKTADPKQTRIQAGRLLKRHDSNLTLQGDVVDAFSKIHRLYKEKGIDAFEEASQIALDTAKQVVSGIAIIHDEGAEQQKEIREFLKDNEIIISPYIEKNMDDFASFRKKNAFRLKLKKGEVSNLDKYIYPRLQELFPTAFPDEYYKANNKEGGENTDVLVDMLRHIGDVLDNPMYEIETIDELTPEWKEYVSDIASDIMETAYGLQTKKTFADKKYEEKVRAVAKAREEALASRDRALAKQAERYETKISYLKQRNKDFKEETRERYEARINDLKEQQKERERKAKERREEAERKQKEHRKQVHERASARRRASEERARQERQEQRDARREKKQDSEARTRLLNIARRLSRIKSTDEFNRIRDQLIGNLDLEAKSMTGKTKMKLEDLEKWYQDQVENNDWFVKNERLEKKFERLRKTHISDMSLEDVQNLTEILLMLEHKVRNDKKLINSQYKKDVFMASFETAEGIKQSKGLKFKGLHKADNIFIGQVLSPIRYMRRLTGYDEDNPLMIATRELQKGEIASLDYRRRALEPFLKFTDMKFTSYLNGNKAPEIEVNATTIDMKPTTVKITPAIRIWFYLSSMNADNMRHIVNGGVRIPDVKLLKKGKRTDAYDNGTLVRFSKSQVQAIIDGMTSKEEAYAKAVFNYFNKVAPEATNAVSETLDGISIAKVKNYVPIHVDDTFLDVEGDTIKMDGTVEGMGSHKERVQSSKPAYAEDVSDLLMRSIDADMKYVGMAIPLRNFGKIYRSSSMESARGQAEHIELTGETNNSPSTLVYGDEQTATYRTRTGGYVSVRDAIRSLWTSDATKYIDKFLSDLQFPHSQVGEVERTLRELTSNYAGAVLTLNASVAIKQSASYPTAGAVLGWKPLIKAFTKVGKLDLDYANSVTPLLAYRAEGFNFREAGDIQNRDGRDSWFKRIMRTPLFNWIQGMDLLTTRKLFKASEIYVQDKYHLKRGQSGYDEKVAEIFNKVITETQPNYTVMERAGHLRSDSTLERTLSMFKTQPYQNFNIWYDATGDYLDKRDAYKKAKTKANREALKEASVNLGNATTSQIAQLAVFAMMTSLWALARGKDDKWRDEEGNLSFASYLKQLAHDMIGGVASEFFLGSDVFSALDSVINDSYYSGFSSVTDSSINDFFNTGMDMTKLLQQAWDYAVKGNEEEIDTDKLLKQMEKVVTEGGRFSGIPTGNLINLKNLMYRWVCVSKDGEYIGEYEALKASFAKDSYKKDILMKAYRNDTTAYNKLRKMMIEDGFKESSLDEYINEQKKENKSESEQKAYDNSIATLERSSLWYNASRGDKDRYMKVVEKLAVGIEDSTTKPYTSRAVDGITEEQVILYKLALDKVDKPNKNGNLGSYDKDDKEEALKLLEREYNFTQKQKDDFINGKW